MPPSVPPARSASDHLLLCVSELFRRVPAAQALSWYFTFVQGFSWSIWWTRLLDVLMGSNGLTKASLPFLNYPAQINQGKIGPFFFFHCSPYAGKYNTLKMLEEQCPMSFSAGNLSSIVAAKFLGSWFLFHLYLLYRVFCFCFSRNTIPFLWGKRKRNIVPVMLQCSLNDWNIKHS